MQWKRTSSKEPHFLEKFNLGKYQHDVLCTMKGSTVH